MSHVIAVLCSVIYERYLLMNFLKKILNWTEKKIGAQKC